MEPINTASIPSAAPLRQADDRSNTAVQQAQNSPQPATQVSISAEAQSQQVAEAVTPQAISPTSDTAESQEARTGTQDNEAREAQNQPSGAAQAFRSVQQGPVDNNLDVIA